MMFPSAGTVEGNLLRIYNIILRLKKNKEHRLIDFKKHLWEIVFPSEFMLYDNC